MTKWEALSSPNGMKALLDRLHLVQTLHQNQILPRSPIPNNAHIDPCGSLNENRLGSSSGAVCP